ncbi:MAG TPA: recombinase RecA [Spirochaetota bacterium]|nr:recombinase RecA [Spirochaetota bacterium]
MAKKVESTSQAYDERKADQEMVPVDTDFQEPPVVSDSPLKEQFDKKRELIAAKEAELKKKFGSSALIISKEGDAKSTGVIEVISTGIMPVDRATLVGGIPRGRVTEIYGPEMSGKTTLTLHTVAEEQKIGGIAAFIDAEHALSQQHAVSCGVNWSDLMVSQPDCGDDALEIAEELIPVCSLIVIDSVAALVPKAEINGDIGDQHMGLQARLMSQALRVLTGKAAKHNTAIVFINQIRHKIGVMFGSPETTAGGNALKFYASMRLDLRRIETINQNDEAVANKVKVDVKKNKVAPPYQREEFHLFFDAKKTSACNAIEFGAKIGVVKKAGSWYSYKDERLGQGLPNAVNYLLEHPAALDEIKQQCKDNMFVPIASYDNVV